jgi:hypothetical protein
MLKISAKYGMLWSRMMGEESGRRTLEQSLVDKEVDLFLGGCGRREVDRMIWAVVAAEAGWSRQILRQGLTLEGP